MADHFNRIEPTLKSGQTVIELEYPIAIKDGPTRRVFGLYLEHDNSGVLLIMGQRKLRFDRSMIASAAIVKANDPRMLAIAAAISAGYTAKILDLIAGLNALHGSNPFR